MEAALAACTVPSLRIIKPKSRFRCSFFNPRPISPYAIISKPNRFTAAVSSSPPVASPANSPTESETRDESGSVKFDWYANWYPVMPICDMDKKAPHGKRVMGLDLVVWWDKKENQWRVMEDTCPHRLAPLSDC